MLLGPAAPASFLLDLPVPESRVPAVVPPPWVPSSKRRQKLEEQSTPASRCLGKGPWLRAAHRAAASPAQSDLPFPLPLGSMTVPARVAMVTLSPRCESSGPVLW